MSNVSSPRRRRLVATVATAATAAVAILPAAPADAGVPTTGLDACESGTPCMFQMGGIPVSTTADDQIVRSEDGTTRLIGTIDLPTPAGDLQLVEAEMLFTPTEYGLEFVRGTTRVPFPAHWFGDTFAASEVPMAEFGMQDGAELAHLGSHLNPGRDYLYFHFSTGLALDLPWPDEPWADVLPTSIAFDAGYSATMVLDPTDPYLYIGGPCPTSAPDPSDAARESGQQQGDDAVDQTSERQDPQDDDTVDQTSEHQDPQDDQEAPDQPTTERTGEPTSIEIVTPGDESVAQDCGIGFSWGGYIPAPGALGRPGFGGHLVVDAPVPLGGVEMDGTSVYSIDIERGVRIVGFGELSAGLPLVGDALDLEVPVGAAIVDVEATIERIGYAVEGVLETEETYEIAANQLRFGLPGEGRIRIASSFGLMNTADGWRVDPDGFFEAAGEIAVGPRSWGEALGVPLDDLAAADATLRIDRHALTLQGGMVGQLHPALATDAGARLDVRADWVDPTASYLRANGSMQVGGTTLGDGLIDVSDRGVVVQGMLTNTVTTVAMSGQVNGAGAELTGRVAVELPLAEIGQAARDTIAAADAAQADVDLLEIEIDRTRAQIMDERRATSDDFRIASIGVDRAARDVASIDASIATNNSKISHLSRRITSERSRYRRLSWWNRVRQAGLHAGRITSYSAGIAGLRTANVGLTAARATAIVALDGARLTLAEIDRGLRAIPVEADPRMAGLITAHATATATLDTTRAAAAPFADLDGAARAAAEFRIGTAGVSGRLHAEWCGASGCTPLAGGRLVQADGSWRACLTTGAGEACTWL